GEVVNGNDLHSVLRTAQRAIDRARKGEGPTLVECKTYRYHGHSEHDRADYRQEEEVITWESRDPLILWEVYLEKRKYDIEAIRRETGEKVKRIIDEAVAFAEASPAPEGPEAMEDLYAMPIDTEAE
ncbi:MAG: thiamine pyrophosphate-dependent enzyme, partial [Verrucomicrobiota bacterium]